MNEASRQYGDERMSGQSSDPSVWSKDTVIKQRNAEKQWKDKQRMDGVDVVSLWSMVIVVPTGL